MQDLIEINENVKLPKKCDRCSLDEFVQILPIVQTRNTWIPLSSKRFFRWSVNLFPIYILYRIPSRALNSFSPRGSRFPTCEESRWKFEEISRLDTKRKGIKGAIKERIWRWLSYYVCLVLLFFGGKITFIESIRFPLLPIFHGQRMDKPYLYKITRRLFTNVRATIEHLGEFKAN